MQLTPSSDPDDWPGSDPNFSVTERPALSPSGTRTPRQSRPPQFSTCQCELQVGDSDCRNLELGDNSQASPELQVEQCPQCPDTEDKASSGRRRLVCNQTHQTGQARQGSSRQSRAAGGCGWGRRQQRRGTSRSRAPRPLLSSPHVALCVR